ncbi:hypothetical protein ACQCSX_17770 [Pseudarthrobacter sp. P1]|uniref:hypothetical protein n=1 Tax=Pseudarthrobacter sp. P1 TaxID=3418418 RepID=UPI003CF55026
MRRKITTALISLAMVILGTVAIAPPANASSGGSFCFVNADGSAYANLPAFVQLSPDNSTGWFNVMEMATEATGCGAFTLTGSYTGYFVRAVAYHDFHNPGEGALIYWSGIAPLNGIPGDAAPHLGTGIVTCTPWALPCEAF